MLGVAVAALAGALPLRGDAAALALIFGGAGLASAISGILDERKESGAEDSAPPDFLKQTCRRKPRSAGR